MSTVLRCFVDDETLKWLEKASAETGRNLEQLAEAAIENAAIEYKVKHADYVRPRSDYTLPRAQCAPATPSAPGASAPAQPLPEQNQSGPRPPGERP